MFVGAVMLTTAIVGGMWGITYGLRSDVRDLVTSSEAHSKLEEERSNNLKEAVGEQNRSAAVAIAKSENSTAESIKQLQVLFSSDRSATNDKINDVKSRLDKGEGISSGFSKGGGVIVQVITSVLSATAIIVTVLLHH